MQKLVPFVISIVVLLFVSQSAKAQKFPYLNPKVIIQGKAKPNGFAGGVGVPQISEIDFNSDGLMDMFVFERYGARILPYLCKKEGFRISYMYAPEYIPNFPRLFDWAILRDYNKDGIQDIFACSSLTQGPFGIEVYKGNPDGTYVLVEYPDEAYDILYYEGSSGNSVNIYVSADDLPAIVDVDGDGDIDILSFESLGSVMHYYRNVAVEEGLGLDVLKFVLDDNCWGKFRESEQSQDVIISNDPDVCATGIIGEDPIENGGQHAGSTTMAFDQDLDGDMDIVLGDLTNKHLVFLKNGGSAKKAWITDQDKTFPSYDVPTEMDIFLASFTYDINKDGVLDLITTPNKVFAEDVNSQWYYIGFVQNEEITFSLEQEDFFAEKMIDLGSGCRPAIVDYNADGLLDIIVGNEYFFREDAVKEARLFVFKNIGSRTNPEFELVDDDYLGLKEFSGSNNVDNLTHYTPSFGDLDGDGDEDLLVGTQQGTLIYFQNTAGSGSPFNFNSPVLKFMNIDVGELAVPFIYDIDQDGLGDLIVGQKTNQNDQTGRACGSMHYFTNKGSVGNPIFDNDRFASGNTPCFGNLFFPKYGSTVESSPFLYEFNGVPRLYLGTNQGIKVMQNVGPEPDRVFELIDEEFGELYSDIETFHIALADLDDDGILEAVIGQKTGGMTILKTDHRVNGSVASTDYFRTNIKLLENPVHSRLIFRGADNFDYSLINITGQVLSSGVYKRAVDISNLKPGIYIIEFQNEPASQSFKFVKY